MPTQRKASVSLHVTATRAQLSCELGEEAVILHTERGIYFGLDPVGTRVWQLIQEPRLVSDICDSITREYEVERDRCEQDVLTLLDNMAEAGLVEFSDASAG